MDILFYKLLSGVILENFQRLKEINKPHREKKKRITENKKLFKKKK